MLKLNRDSRSQIAPRRLPCGSLLIFALTIFALCPSAVLATVQNVENYGAKGDNGVTNDTGPISTAISLLQPGDTLLFPCTTGNIYVITSQLTINVPDVTVDGSGCAIIKDTFSNSGTPTGKIMLIGGNGSSIYATYGPAVVLSTTANELATSFTTASSLGVSPGDYVYLCQGGTDGSSAPAASCPQPAPSGTCDPDGCRGEVVKVASVSGNTVTVTTALHDTYDPTANSAEAAKIINSLSGISVKNITLDGSNSNAYGLVLAGVVYSTVNGVTVTEVQGAGVVGGGDFNVAWNNITVTHAGSANCGAAAQFDQQGNLSINSLSVSQENTQQPSGDGTCFVSAGAFGFTLSGSANSTITNVTVDACGTYGRPFKTTAARWNTLNSVTVENGSLINDNGFTIEYYSSHNNFNNCVATNNGASGSGTGNAGIKLFGNYNQYNVFSNCTVTGNGNIQFFDDLGTDSNNSVVGGTYASSSQTTSYAVVLLGAPYDTVSGVTVSGPATYGIGMAGPSGSALGASNACINNNVLSPGTNLANGIFANSTVSSTDIGSGNQLNGFSNNLTAGTCTAP